MARRLLCDSQWVHGILLVLCFFSASVYGDSVLLWPKPQSQSSTGETFVIDPSTFNFVPTGVKSSTLESGFSRYLALVFYKGLPLRDAQVMVPRLSSIKELNVNVMSSDETLGLTTDETYTLEINAPSSSLTAKTVYGALRGLETFSQVVVHDVSTAQYTVQQLSVQDGPHFAFRGMMLDSSRHFLPLPVLYQNLDAMAYSKMNVFHWHIVDSQSFPYVSTAYPALSQKGAYLPVSTHTYSPEDVQKVIAYAQQRGIRVIPEFDTPGHTESWGNGEPDLLTVCYKNGKPSTQRGPVNPTLNTTYQFLSAFFSEVAKAFPDQYIHLGGDEVSFDCWLSNPNILAWMQQHGFTQFSQLEQYYEAQLLDIVGGIGKEYIIWQDVFDNGVKVRPNTVVDVWRSGAFNDTLARVTAAGYRTILSSCWYLNYISYGVDWPKYYQCDPLNFTGSTEQKKLVMGGEACMWGEYVDQTNLISRTWPRAAAVAERLWTYKIESTELAEVRLHNHRCRLIRRNLPAEPASGPSYCEQEYSLHYEAPWNQ